MTDKLREAAQMALDALEYAEQNHGGDDCYFDAIEALRAALAQPEQEPGAWVYQHKDTGLTMCVLVQQVESGFEKNNPRWQKSTPLYTATPQPEPVATLFGSLPVYDVPPKQEPVAWRTFDGEGGYEFRSYEMNENYAEDWAQRNPNHKGWVEPLYKDPTPCQTCESLARTVMMDQTSHDTAPPQRKFIGLTDEEIEDACWTEVDQRMRSFARAIEAKLKEKNT